jgi:hypothetical protein
MNTNDFNINYSIDGDKYKNGKTIPVTYTIPTFKKNDDSKKVNIKK